MATFSLTNLHDSGGIETTDFVPSELKQREQWLCYRVDNGDKIPKAPRWTVDGDYIKKIGVQSNDEWATFDEASAFVDETQQRLSDDEALDGVGFVLTEDDPYAFLDLDYFIEDGEMTEAARDILDETYTWTEVSQSGEGLHAFCHVDDWDDSFKSRNDDVGVELYYSNRFCAVTGDTVTEYPKTVKERDNAVRTIQEDHLERSPGSKKSMEPIEAPDEFNSDDVKVQEVVETAKAYDDEFEELYEGRHICSNDASASDLYFISKCLFWAKGDERLARSVVWDSRRPRAKWDESRGSQTWLDYQFDEASRTQSDTYSGSYKSSSTSKFSFADN